MDSTTFSRGGDAYRTNAVMTASPEKLVLIMYDGALTALDRAQAALVAGEGVVVATALAKAYAIVAELRATLDLENGGDLAQQLFALYGFITRRINAANAERQPLPITEARDILARLREGWDGLVNGS